MKKVIIAIIGLALLFPACRYEEPSLSFTSVKKRIRGEWSLSKIYKNGEITETESPSVVESKSARYGFYKREILIIKYNSGGILCESSGSWVFGEKKKTLNLVFLDQYYNLSREYEIVKFKNNELKVRFKDDKAVEWTLILSLEYSFVPYDL